MARIALAASRSSDPAVRDRQKLDATHAEDAGAVVIEQALRLNRLRREPAGSVFALLVRPLVRDLFR